ncbi:hypothetical protein ISN44_As10g013000, partial [Arabidopsis suecica]
MANQNFKIHALCLLTTLLQNLRPSISNLSPISTWVSFYKIQNSLPCAGDVISGIDWVSDSACCDQVPPQSRASFLSIRESVSPTLYWPQPKCYDVGFFPFSNGVRRFFTGTSLFPYNRVFVSQMNLSNSEIRNQFWIWDPGVIYCDSIVCVKKLRMHLVDHNRIEFSKVSTYIVTFWGHDLIRCLCNASARYTVESLHKISMGNCVNRHDFMTIRRHKSDFLNKNHFVEINVERVTGRKTAARESESCVKNSHTSWYRPAEDTFLCQIYNTPIHLNKRLERSHKNSLAPMLGEEEDGFVLLPFSNVNGLHQYWPSPSLQSVIFNNFNTSRNTSVLFGFKISVRSGLICDDDVDCVVGSNILQVASLTEVRVTMNMLLCQGLWSSLLRFRDLSESGKLILFVIMLKKITKSSFSIKTLVRKFWYHRVYISELLMDISGLKLRFAKRKFSHKLL